MEHSPNVIPMKRRERFDFDEFDRMIAEALGERAVGTEAEVVDLNANVIDLEPPDDAA